MLSLEDKRWQNLEGGYRTSFDPRPLLSDLETKKNAKATWHELWEGLHHQGDVGAASYAAVPHLVRIYRKRGIIDWNTYAIVAVIELARDDGKNPKVPKWLEDDYFQAIQDFGEFRIVLRFGHSVHVLNPCFHLSNHVVDLHRIDTHPQNAKRLRWHVLTFVVHSRRHVISP